MLATAIIGSSMTFIDGTVVNVRLPVLREQLAASAAEAQWIVERHQVRKPRDKDAGPHWLRHVKIEAGREDERSRYSSRASQPGGT